MIRLEIRPGEGGRDATLFAQDLLTAYADFAAAKG